MAELAGCSTATVSKALNGLPVSAENLRRVYAAAEQLGYVPNLAARSMRQEKTMTLGMVVNFEGHPRSELLYVFQDLIANMESAGYSVLLSIVRNEGLDLDTLLQRFLAHRVDGLFYWQARPSNTLAWYERSNIPVIAVGFRDPRCAQLPFVTVDGAPAFAAACRDLKAHGHRDFAEIVVDRVAPLHKLYPRMRGVRWREIRIGHDEQDVRDAVEEHLTGPDAPTAVFAAPPTATTLLSAAGELGLRVPEDLSVVSFFDLEDAPLFRTPLSAIRTDYDKLGAAVATAMLDALAGREVGDVLIPASTHYIPRASTGPARERA
ncbi:LacI family DNA-binding transcriptional regulator [Pseudonocardia benzenivorans]|uniref:LacI family DNA-binding transcriptional regulator n=1 Tax=Pseudonocardia benzenivorans TaxID=228005 RepID=A0ABW3VQR3_9PSEU|nr:LacI family DNA-binding transcriptional regulator [Pseudonocardia dioxanivorans]GJF05991.1 LacI family transcriptional regulator [Pseudonocardia sp. D17]